MFLKVYIVIFLDVYIGLIYDSAQVDDYTFKMVCPKKKKTLKMVTARGPTCSENLTSATICIPYFTLKLPPFGRTL